MTLTLETHDGGSYRLPALLRWDVELTGSVPCDSLEAVCPYDPGMAEILPEAVRFTAGDGGRTVLRGVVDACETVMDEGGLLLTVEGRGLCALLLDNESEAVTYGQSDLREILSNHAAPHGVLSRIVTDVRGGSYSVASGSSQWKAIAGFTGRFGGFEPYFTGGGVLVAGELRGSGETVTVGAGTPLLSLTRRDQRYGVISEVLIRDKSGSVRERVVNGDFAARGGQRRHVLYVPKSASAAERRYTGAYQIAQSALERLEITAALPWPFAAAPGDRVALTLPRLGLSGTYDVFRARSRLDGGGERTELTLRGEADRYVAE